MSIANRYPLAVSFQLPSIHSVVQSVELISDPMGYDYFLYSGEKKLIQIDVTKCLQELLELVPNYPFAKYIRQDPLSMARYWNETHERDDLDREKVLTFIRRWGRIGQLSRAREGIYELNQQLYATALGIKDADRAKFDPEQIRLLDLKNMAEGKMIPFSWAQDNLRQLAKMARLTLNLERNLKSNQLAVDLNRKNMKRMLAAWNCLSIAFEDSIDVASPKLNLHKVWEIVPKGRKEVIDQRYCAGIYAEYIQNINHFLSPITQRVLTTSNFETLNKIYGSFETAFAGILYKFWTDEMRISQRCLKCNRPFIPLRNREDRKYCGNRCRESVNKKTYRQRRRAKSTSTIRKIPVQTKRKEGK